MPAREYKITGNLEVTAPTMGEAGVFIASFVGDARQRGWYVDEINVVLIGDDDDEEEVDGEGV